MRRTPRSGVSSRGEPRDRQRTLEDTFELELATKIYSGGTRDYSCFLATMRHSSMFVSVVVNVPDTSLYEKRQDPAPFELSQNHQGIRSLRNVIPYFDMISYFRNA